MASKIVVNALMREYKISRSIANNMVNRNFIDTGFDNIQAYRKYRKSAIVKRYKTTTTIRKHRTSRVKKADTVLKKSK